MRKETVRIYNILGEPVVKVLITQERNYDHIKIVTVIGQTCLSYTLDECKLLVVSVGLRW